MSAELPMYSGLWYRLIWYGVIFVITVWYVLRYANKITKDPTLSIMYGVETDEEEISNEFMPRTTRQKIIIAEFISLIGIMLFGVFKYGWFMLGNRYPVPDFRYPDWSHRQTETQRYGKVLRKRQLQI